MMIRFATLAATIAAVSLLTLSPANAQSFTIDFDAVPELDPVNDNFDNGVNTNFTGVEVNYNTNPFGASNSTIGAAGFGPQTDGGRAGYAFPRDLDPESPGDQTTGFDAFEITFLAESAEYAVVLDSIDLQLFEYDSGSQVSPTSVTANVQIYSSIDNFVNPVYDVPHTFGFTPLTIDFGGVQSPFGGVLVLFVDYTGLTVNDPRAGGITSANGYIGLDNIRGQAIVPGPGALVTALMGAVPAAGMLLRRRRR